MRENAVKGIPLSTLMGDPLQIDTQEHGEPFLRGRIDGLKDRVQALEDENAMLEKQKIKMRNVIQMSREELNRLVDADGGDSVFLKWLTSGEGDE